MQVFSGSGVLFRNDALDVKTPLPLFFSGSALEYELVFGLSADSFFTSAGLLDVVE